MTTPTTVQLNAPYLILIGEETGLPCVDPLIDGCLAIVDQIKQLYPQD